MKLPNPSTWIFVFLTGCWLFTDAAFAGLQPFPLTAGQRGTVTCLENPSISYDIYLPPAYSTNGPPLPILYTLNPNGGGLVANFQTVCASLNIIVVGVMSSQNGATLDVMLRDFYAVPRDIRQRVLFDPTAQMVSGFSGGGENAYIFCRFWAQHISGLFAMSGWMGNTLGPDATVVYFTTSHVQTNLIVVCTTGTSDDITQTTFLGPDSNYLASCGAIVKDVTFPGLHAIPPDSFKTPVLNFILSRRTPAGPNDQANSHAQADNWRSRIASGQSEAVLRECVNTLMKQPRTWFALEAQLVMDDLMTNYDSFRTLNVSNLAQGDFASDLFFYAAFGAATNHDWQRYDANLKALNGVTGTSGDRAGDIYYLLTTYGYTAPLLQMSTVPVSGQANVWLREDAPGLSYSLQSLSDLASGGWLDIPSSAVDTGTIWSATVDADPAAASGFYRATSDPVFGTSPPWPNGIFVP